MITRLTWLILLALFAAGQAHAQEKPIVAELSDGVFHYYAGYYSSLIVVGEDAVLVTDPASAPRAEAMKAAIAELTDNPVTHVVLSHEHYDHAGGTEVFEGAKVVCHRMCAKVFALDRSGQAPASVDIEFDDSLEIDIGGTAVQLTHVGPADGAAATLTYLPEAKILVAVDMFGPRSLTPPTWQDDVNHLGVREVLNTIRNWDVAHVITGHAGVTGPDMIAENAAFFNDLHDAVAAKIAEIMATDGVMGVIGAIDNVPDVELPQYADWANYDTALPTYVRGMILGLFHGE